MKPVLEILEQRISETLLRVSGLENCPAIVRPAADAKFGDYQANGIMPAAKRLKINPRQLAEKVAAQLNISDICQTPQIAGPGFINLCLKTEFIENRLLQIFADAARLGIDKTEQPQTVVVDYSGPNIAKEMHVGHLRSTIIGDAIARILDFQGHNVIRQNHIGDWGTALGKVILGLWHMCMAEKHGGKAYYENELIEINTHKNNKLELSKILNRIRDRHEKDWEEDFEGKRGNGNKHFGPFLINLKGRKKKEIWEKITTLYQYVNILEELSIGMGMMIPTRKKKKTYQINEDPFEYVLIPYESLSRHITAMLQNIDDEDNEQEKEAWQLVRNISLDYCHEIYERLNVLLTINDVRGESDYRKELKSIVEGLLNKGLAKISDGAVCVFLKDFKNKEGEELPFIIQKSDEAHLYATTDLEAIRFRLKEIGAKRVIYVTDARQTLHFKMLFAVVKMVGWADDSVKLEHVTFGTMLGDNGKPFKTRSGENVSLKILLDEAVQRAKTVADEKNPDLPEQQKQEIAQAVGIGAVKYADYSNNRDSDYVFSFDKMLAMEGNTAPYMQYAYARIRSIERKAGPNWEEELAGIREINLTDSAEIEVAKIIIRYDQTIEAAAAGCRPNFLTAYLYDLAQVFSRFYNACPVLQAGPDARPSRLLLCELTARTIEHGLCQLLGINVPDRM